MRVLFGLLFEFGENRRVMVKYILQMLNNTPCSVAQLVVSLNIYPRDQGSNPGTHTLFFYILFREASFVLVFPSNNKGKILYFWLILFSS